MSQPFAYYVGVDWGASFHQVCIQTAEGGQSPQLRVEHAGEAVRRLLARLGELGPAESVAIAIESPSSPVTEPLLAAGFAVYACNPRQSDRFRDRMFPAGSKDDARDALVLASSLRSDPGCFRRLAPRGPALQELRTLTRSHREAHADLRDFANRLRDILLSAWPEMLAFEGSDAAD